MLDGTIGVLISVDVSVELFICEDCVLMCSARAVLAPVSARSMTCGRSRLHIANREDLK